MPDPDLNFPVTVTVQIGNTDNKLSQREWHDFTCEVHADCARCGNLHFSGYSPSNAEWQNACYVISVKSAERLDLLRTLLKAARKIYRQDSIAIVCGNVSFV